MTDLTQGCTERLTLTKFSELSLAPELMKALTDQGYDTPTPIQAQAIPLVKQGHDLLGIAQTGTGKTAAFALPTIDYLVREYRDPPKRGGRVLVLAPTRELAQQIAASFRDYGKHANLSVACIFGGASVRGQIKAVVGGNDVLVATPGRLLDLIDQKALRLSDIEVLILDEADQMMDMGFIHALKKIVPMLPKNRQTLFFSATMPKKIKQLADQFLTTPKTVSVTPAASTAERVEQQIYRCGKSEKQALLVTLLQAFDYNRVLVFSRTKHGADRIVKKLAAAGFPAGALHGNKSQGQRQRILAAFKSGQSSVLVATDIAARGIDIDGITHVINYDLPNVADQYVHRIGRTARAGRSGLAVSFCSPDENAYLKAVRKSAEAGLRKRLMRRRPISTARCHQRRNNPLEMRVRKIRDAAKRPLVMRNVTCRSGNANQRTLMGLARSVKNAAKPVGPKIVQRNAAKAQRAAVKVNPLTVNPNRLARKAAANHRVSVKILLQSDQMRAAENKAPARKTAAGRQRLNGVIHVDK